MTKQQLIDPVDTATAEQKANDIEELKSVFDITNLRVSDFKGAQLRDARPRHPFDGYPEKTAKIGTYKDSKGKEHDLIVNLTHLLLYREQVKQDPSGERVTAGFPEMRNAQGKVIRPNTEKVVTIMTAHNRRAKDYESGGVDTECVFDRTIHLADGVINQACIVQSPSVRAQIVFRYNSKTQRIEPDQRYLMADPDQVARLRRLFEMIINPRIRLEESIRRTFDDGGESFESKDMPGIPEGV